MLDIHRNKATPSVPATRHNCTLEGRTRACGSSTQQQIQHAQSSTVASGQTPSSADPRGEPLGTCSSKGTVSTALTIPTGMQPQLHDTVPACNQPVTPPVSQPPLNWQTHTSYSSPPCSQAQSPPACTNGYHQRSIDMHDVLCRVDSSQLSCGRSSGTSTPTMPAAPHNSSMWDNPGTSRRGRAVPAAMLPQPLDPSSRGCSSDGRCPA